MVVSFNSIQNATIKQACETILKQNKKKVNDLTIMELIIQKSEPLQYFYGLYMFFDSDGVLCLHIGRVISPQFVERVPAHFALNEASWLNQFLKHHKVHNNLTSLNEAVFSAKDCQILLLPMPHEFIEGAEKLFILFLDPKYNKKIPSSSYYRKISVGMTVTSAIQILKARKDSAC